MYPTCIIRHRRENLKKCSLNGLEGKKEIDGKNKFIFYTYPNCVDCLPDFSKYVLLDLEGPPLSEEDSQYGLILIDATWRLAGKMLSQLPVLQHIPKRCIPVGCQTAYPRRQDDCKDPSSGLASIEALYIAYTLLGRKADTLLDEYYWKEPFLSKNREWFQSNKKVK